MATTTQRNFLSLRKRLDQLGYRQPLPVESLPLVERLFEDLVHTTESLRTARLELGQRSQQENEVSDHIQPFKNENARLVQENKELHLRNIKEKEEGDNKIRDAKSVQRRLEHQNADLRFLNTQYLAKINALERDVRDRNQRIQELQEKNLQAVIQTPGGRKKAIAFRRQRMELDSTVPPSSRESAGTSRPPEAPDPYVADLLQVADRRIEELKEELEQCTTEKNTAERRIESLCQQVESRDAEIARLGVLLEGGRPTRVILAEGRHDSNEKLVAHLRVQLECLEQSQQEHDKEMGEVLRRESALQLRCEEVEGKNSRLCEELKNIKSLTSQLESEVGEMRSQREQVVAVVAEREHELQKKTTELTQLKQDCQRVQVDLKCLRQLLETSEEDAHQSTKLLEQLDREKRQLEERYSRLAESERQLRLELDSLQHVATLREEDRAHRSAAEHQRVGRALDDLLGSKEALQGFKEELQQKCNDLERRCRLLQEERDYYHHEHEALQRHLGIAARSAVDQTSRSQLQKDNEQLLRQLRRFEAQLTTIREDLEKVRQERDALMNNYQQLQKEVKIAQARSGPSLLGAAHLEHSYRQTLNESQRAQEDLEQHRNSTPSTPMEDVRLERDELNVRVRSLRSMLANLEEQLKSSSAALTNALSEKRQAEAVSSELQTQLSSVRERSARLEAQLQEARAERAALQAETHSCRVQVSESEQELRAARADLQQAQEQLEASRHRASELRVLLAEGERSRDLQAQQLTQKTQMLLDAQRHASELQQAIANHEQTQAQGQEAMCELREALQKIDLERDNLQAELDSRAEFVHHLQESKDKDVRSMEDIQHQLKHKSSQLRRVEEQCTDQRQQLSALEQQLDSCQTQLQQAYRQRDSEAARVRQLLSDQHATKREVEALQAELKRVIEDRESLKNNIQSYASRVLEFEEALEANEREKAELLESYHRLSDEMSQLDESARSSRNETSGVRVELGQILKEHTQLKAAFQQKIVEIQQLSTMRQDLEARLSAMAASVAHLESELRQSHEETRAAITDRASARDLCVHLDQAQDALQQQLQVVTMETEKLQTLHQSESCERQAVESLLEAERVKVKNLESLLTLERVEVGQKHVHTQHQEQQNTKLQRDLQESLAKCTRLEQEVRGWQQQTSALSDQVQQLQHQLTNERFEKALTIQQLQPLRSSMASHSCSSTASAGSAMTQSDGSGVISPVQSSLHLQSAVQTHSAGHSNHPSQDSLSGHSDRPLGDSLSGQLPPTTSRPSLVGGQEVKTSSLTYSESSSQHLLSQAKPTASISTSLHTAVATSAAVSSSTPPHHGADARFLTPHSVASVRSSLQETAPTTSDRPASTAVTSGGGLFPSTPMFSISGPQPLPISASTITTVTTAVTAESQPSGLGSLSTSTLESSASPVNAGEGEQPPAGQHQPSEWTVLMLGNAQEYRNHSDRVVGMAHRKSDT